MGDEKVKEKISFFQSLLAEGEKLYTRGLFEEATVILGKALEQIYAMDNGELFMKGIVSDCLIARSRCKLAMGDGNGALEDAQEALKESKKRSDQYDPNALLCKAEALYTMGNFEQAVIYFNKGCTMKPDWKEFHLGFRKSVDAIRQAVNSVDISHLKKWRIRIKKEIIKNELKPVTAKTKQISMPIRDERFSADKFLLEELAEDRDFLEALLRDSVFNQQEDIQRMIQESIKYLDGRIEFWRQRNPKSRKPAL